MEAGDTAMDVQVVEQKKSASSYFGNGGFGGAIENVNCAALILNCILSSSQWLEGSSRRRVNGLVSDHINSLQNKVGGWAKKKIRKLGRLG